MFATAALYAEEKLFLFQPEHQHFSSPHSGYLFLPVCNEADSCEQIYLDITESHLVSSFYDFLLYLKENFCYSPDETGKVLRRILQEFHTRV